MKELLELLLLNEYVFTFLVTALSVVFKGLTTSETLLFRSRQTYDLGVEFVFIALSFGLSNLAEINKRAHDLVAQQKQLASGTAEVLKMANNSLPLRSSLQQQLNGQLLQIDLASSALWVIVSCLALLLIIMVYMIRKFGHDGQQKPDIWRGIILPNLIGIFAVILVMAHVYEIDGN